MKKLSGRRGSGRRRSTSPSFTTVSRSPRSLRSRIWGLWNAAGAVPATLEGYTALDGEKPVNTSGGLKSKGHPVGATGVAQICEVVEQIRGECGQRQVKHARTGLIENLGGSGATCVVGVFSA